MRIKNQLLISSVLFGISIVAVAATPSATEIVNTAVRSAIASNVAAIQTIAIQVLSSLVLAQFLVTFLGALKSGADLDAVWGKLLGSLLWFGFCFYVMSNGADFIGKVGQQFIDLGGAIAGAGNFSAGYILEWGVHLAGSLLSAVDNAKGGGVLALLDFLPSLLAGVCALVILATAALIAFKVFLVKIEIAVVVMMSPLSFSLLGLNALRDQGIAPFKSLLSMIYRIILLAIICKSMATTGENVLAVLNKIGSGSLAEIWDPIFAALFGYVLLGFLAFKSDSIAASISSGATNLGTADVASAAAMGGALGAAMATMGAAGAGAASGASKSMSDVIAGMSGGAGSISNAGGSGWGGGLVPSSPSESPRSSLSGPRSGAPVGPAFATNKAGAPIGPKATDTQKAPAPAQSESDAKAADGLEAEKASARAAEQSAGIGGNANAADQKMLDRLLENAAAIGGQGKKSALDHLATANHHMANEKAATGVSINPHHD